MTKTGGSSDPHVLRDGAKIAVIGGGPAGSFFTIFAFKMAKMVDKDLAITIFEPQDFTKDGPGGCNKCGGVVSELLVQTLAVEGINLPDSVVRRGIHSFTLQTNHGNVSIATPSQEKRIATVYRGGGPKGVFKEDKESFDNFLLKKAIQEGAVHRSLKIDRVENRSGKPILFSTGEEAGEFDLVVGAFGMDGSSAGVFEGMGFGYERPQTITTAIGEIALGRDVISECFGSSIHLFLIPLNGVEFAAMIPKDTFVTVCILGKKVTANIVEDFLGHPVVAAVMPKDVSRKLDCFCLPRMNVGAPRRPFADRFVLCGDSGSTRLYKDGIGSAYLMGKAAAKAAVFHGVGGEHFRTHYYPIYKSIAVDNLYGRLLFFTTDFYRRFGVFCRGMLAVVEKEQAEPDDSRVLSHILWDMFTGSERYRNVFRRTLNLRMNMRQVKNFGKILLGGDHD